jgi:truncated hemoglobin YjbI
VAAGALLRSRGSPWNLLRMLTNFYIMVGLLFWCAALTLFVLGLYWHTRSTRAKIEEWESAARNGSGAGVTSVGSTRSRRDPGRAGGSRNSAGLHVAAGLPPDEGARLGVLQPPPTVWDAAGRPITVKDWLTHYWPEGPGWPAIVAEFYNRAAADPAIAEFFRRTDMPALRKHFTHMMIILTKDGVTVATRDYLANAHAGLRNKAGRPITGDIYDSTINVLVQVLVDAGIPDDAINELARTVTPLRAAIVRDFAA